MTKAVDRNRSECNRGVGRVGGEGVEGDPGMNKWITSHQLVLCLDGYDMIALFPHILTELNLLS